MSAEHIGSEITGAFIAHMNDYEKHSISFANFLEKSNFAGSCKYELDLLRTKLQLN